MVKKNCNIKYNKTTKKCKESKQKSKIKKNRNEKVKNSQISKNSEAIVKIFDKKAVVDQYFAGRNLYHIFEDKDNVFNGKYFNCTLNKSNLSQNNNKFYIIQLLEHDSDNSLILFTRWGRVGVPGQHDEKNVDRNSGPKLFMKKYKDKTINHNYKEIYIDYEAEVKNKDTPNKKACGDKKKKHFKNSLSEDVMDLIRIIYNKKMINDSLHEIGYDSKKMPLGKLSSITLKNGLNILKQIESELKKPKPNRENLIRFSSDFYTQIPHDFGFKKMSNFIIDSIDKVKEKIDMISNLSDMKITLKILDNTDSKEEYENQEEKQLNDCYKQLNCDIRSISKKEPIYSTLNKYLTAKISNKNSKDSFYYRSNSLSLLKAYELNRHGEENKFKDLGNKKLLWHGTRMTNFVGILSQGLRIAPPEAPSSGYLYGKGVYFADMSQKSSYYCYPVNNMALILLGEVSLGKEDKRTTTDYNLPSTLKKNNNSIHALGSLEPSGGEFIDGDVFVPNKDIIIKNNNSYRSYSEYIVYNVDQIRLRYLLQIKYN